MVPRGCSEYSTGSSLIDCVDADSSDALFELYKAPQEVSFEVNKYFISSECSGVAINSTYFLDRMGCGPNDSGVSGLEAYSFLLTSCDTYGTMVRGCNDSLCSDCLTDATPFRTRPKKLARWPNLTLIYHAIHSI